VTASPRARHPFTSSYDKETIMTHIIRYVAFAVMLGGFVFSAAHAADSVTVNISLKDHQFQPAEPHAPAGKPFVIVLKNLDAAPAEFESSALHVEKVVTAGGSITMRIRPMRPGRYRFFNDFHRETEGYLVVQ
jgi:plastocyanin